MIGLDDFSFPFDPQDHLSELDLQPHPAVSGKERQTFYFEYLFKAKQVIPEHRRHSSAAITRTGRTPGKMRPFIMISLIPAGFCAGLRREHRA